MAIGVVTYVGCLLVFVRPDVDTIALVRDCGTVPRRDQACWI
jgi:hypothetical protein